LISLGWTVTGGPAGVLSLCSMASKGPVQPQMPWSMTIAQTNEERSTVLLEWFTILPVLSSHRKRLDVARGAKDRIFPHILPRADPQERIVHSITVSSGAPACLFSYGHRSPGYRANQQKPTSQCRGHEVRAGLIWIAAVVAQAPYSMTHLGGMSWAVNRFDLGFKSAHPFHCCIPWHTLLAYSNWSADFLHLLVQTQNALLVQKNCIVAAPA
jgi:hypothetical protein